MTSKTAVSAQEAILAQKELDIAIKILAHQNIFAQLALALQCYAHQDGTVKELEKAWSSLLSVLKASFVLQELKCHPLALQNRFVLKSHLAPKLEV